MKRIALVATIVALVGCEDRAQLETIAELDRAVTEARARSRLLMERQRAMAAVPTSANTLATGSPEEVRGRIVALGSTDRVEVKEDAGVLAVQVHGERGRRQAVQALLAYAVDAPAMELAVVEVEEPAWSMRFALKRPRTVATATSSVPRIEVPEPSFFSFSEGEALHARAVAKQRELEQLAKIVDELEAREAKRKSAAAMAVDEDSMARFRARRYFAIALLPDVGKGRLTFSEDRATWKGTTTFEDLDAAKAALSGRGEVLGFAPGERGSLEARIGGAAEDSGAE